MKEFATLIQSSILIFFAWSNCFSQTTNTMPSSLADATQKSPRIAYTTGDDAPSCIKEMGLYSPKIEQQLTNDFKNKFDANDYEVVVNAIKAIQADFRNWDEMPLESRKKLEIAHQHAVRLLALVFKCTADQEVKQKIFLFFDESYKTDGKYLASLIFEIPCDSLVISKGGVTQIYTKSFFLTDNLWKLLERTDDPAVTRVIIAHTYRMDNGSGYAEASKKAERIMNKGGDLTDGDKMTLFCINQLKSYQQYNMQAREDPNFDIKMVPITPPRPMLLWQVEQEKPGPKTGQFYTTGHVDATTNRPKKSSSLLQQPTTKTNFHTEK